MADAPSDYVDRAVEYAKEAAADDGSKHGRLIRQAASRFLNDLDRAERDDCPFYFDRWCANDPCDFIEKLPHVEGTWETPEITLHPSHIFLIVQLFGFRSRETGTRRYTSVLFAVARKNAKSTISAAILLYCLCCEDEPGAQVISAATTFDQAAIIFKIAKAMVDRTPDLRDEFGLQVWSKAITCEDIGANFKPLHAKASTQDGLNPSHTALDEIHAHKTADLLNVLTSAAGARANPLWLYTTTEGYINGGPWEELRKFGRDLLEGVFEERADHFLVVFYAIDPEDDEFSEATWRKANPLMDVNPLLLNEIRKLAVEAKSMPTKLSEFRIKRLNRQAATGESIIDLVAWDQCGGTVPLEELKGLPCYGGLDLASNRDICSFRLVFPLDDGRVVTHAWRWVPESAVEWRTERGTVPYAGWVEDGHLIQTPGNITDYDAIKDAVLWAYNEFDLLDVAYDRWNAARLVNALDDEGVPLIEFIQGPKSYHPAFQAFERAYISGALAHGGDPVLKWCASNLVPRYDANLNVAPDRKRSADKIDDMVALLMAFGLYAVAIDEEQDIGEPIIV